MNIPADRRPMILAGSGRRGKSWIGNVLSSCAGTYSVLEPIRRARVPQVSSFTERSDHLGYYLPTDEHDCAAVPTSECTIPESMSAPTCTFYALCSSGRRNVSVVVFESRVNQLLASNQHEAVLGRNRDAGHATCGHSVGC